MRKCLTLVIMMLFCTTSLLHAEESESLIKPEISPKAGWKAWQHPEYIKAGSTVSFKDNQIIVKAATKDKVKKQFTAGQQVYFNIDLDADKTYELSFTTSSDIPGTLRVVYILGKKPFSSYAGQNVMLKTDKPQKHVIKFTPKANKQGYDTPRSLRFFCGQLFDGTMTISDIKLVEVEK